MSVQASGGSRRSALGRSDTHGNSSIVCWCCYVRWRRRITDHRCPVRIRIDRGDALGDLREYLVHLWTYLDGTRKTAPAQTLGYQCARQQGSEIGMTPTCRRPTSFHEAVVHSPPFRYDAVPTWRPPMIKSQSDRLVESACWRA